MAFIDANRDDVVEGRLPGVELVALWEDNCRVVGARKLWRAAGRTGVDIGRDQVARLMRSVGMEGARRSRRVRTTKAGPVAARYPDLVERRFEADPGRFTRSPRSRRARKRIWSTDPLERLNMEVERRTDVVGVFPDPEALLRLADAVLVEAHDDWHATDSATSARAP